MRKIAISISALMLLLVLAACGSGGESSVDNPTSTPKAFVSAAEAMNASSESFQTSVQSFEGTMTIGIEAEGDSYSTNGAMKFQAPDKVYLNMDIPGAGDMEMLLAAPEMYVKVDGKWYKSNLDSLGVDFEEFKKYAEDRGPVDYADALKGLKDQVKLSDEVIDGKTYWHYYGTLDLASLGDELPEGVFDQQYLDLASSLISSTGIDVYVDPVTLLPRRYAMKMTMDFGKPITMNMQMDFVKYNEPVEFPDVPADAPPLTDVTPFFPQ